MLSTIITISLIIIAQSYFPQRNLVDMRRFNLLNTKGKSAFTKNVNVTHQGEVISFIIQANTVKTKRRASGVQGLLQMRVFPPTIFPTIITAAVIMYMTSCKPGLICILRPSQKQ